MKKKFSLLFLIPLAVILVLSEWIVRSGTIPSYLLPTPSSVFEIIFVRPEDLWTACYETLSSAAVGFICAGIFGTFIGVLLSLSRWVERAFYPYAIFFQTVPIIAIAPLLVIWIGYGKPTVITSALIVSIFPVIASTLAGIQSTDLNLLSVFKLYKADRWQTLVKLRLPFALPQIFVGLKITAGLAVIGAIVGEFITGGGLGGIIDVARTRQRVDMIFAALSLASLIGLFFVAVVNLASHLSLRNWHASEILDN